jgi:hypothetical protein
MPPSVVGAGMGGVMDSAEGVWMPLSSGPWPPPVGVLVVPVSLRLHISSAALDGPAAWKASPGVTIHLGAVVATACGAGVGDIDRARITSARLESDPDLRHSAALNACDTWGAATASLRELREPVAAVAWMVVRWRTPLWTAVGLNTTLDGETTPTLEGETAPVLLAYDEPLNSCTRPWFAA